MSALRMAAISGRIFSAATRHTTLLPIGGNRSHIAARAAFSSFQISSAPRLARPSSSQAPALLRRTLATAVDLPDLDLPKSAIEKASQLKGVIDPRLYSALVDAPFHYKDLTVPQKTVLSLMPELGLPPNSNEVQAGGLDLLIKSRTGTGKTIAFLLPALEAALRKVGQDPEPVRKPRGRFMRNTGIAPVRTLIISPTRELASQIADEANKLMSNIRDCRAVFICGGMPKGPQFTDLQYSTHNLILVATPGRCIDLMQNSPDFAKALEGCETLVLDEADRLLDMGFTPDIEEICKHLPNVHNRRTLMFSATISPRVQQAARAFLQPRYKYLDTVPASEANAHERIQQTVITCDGAHDQISTLMNILAQDQLEHPLGKAIIFCSTTKLTQYLTRTFAMLKRHLPWGRGTEVVEIHSGKEQRSRDSANRRFRGHDRSYAVLITSDVSARGVDYKGVTRVIQMGLPKDRDTYTHRIGRTGRAEANGRADLLLLPFEADSAQVMLNKMPFETLDSEQVATATKEAAEAFDERTANKVKRSPEARAMASIHAGALVSEQISAVESTMKDVVAPNTEPDDISDVVGSLFGYYRGIRDGSLRDEEVYEGLKEWVDALTGGAGRVPSMNFLVKIGYGGLQNDRPSRSGGSFGGRSRSGSDFGSFGGRSSFRGAGNRSDDRSSFGGSRGAPREYQGRKSDAAFGGRSFDDGRKGRRTFDRPDKFSDSRGSRSPFRSY
ncbi:uncharacterized protein L969DRAFT_43513 [Mixia osmundae IAM 14324]|uniref:ATP-dependent RNA helicase n=1 Tax=Mixia osmundae (strain CBS 9802 / IAM 14324 / JCM 22182 / KY 12970) TaxID=764103 RepID=G7E095_MIXOS|nr:uncharacterized protein L969DRAFT_43513 [Mixia osmundae IAM 14324]KEI42245.1 hypothetical protein L969DRAFT_43513 [Mixia osmundae IAM 14324]GAA96255.1 hypothetical protein E5Q_02919 [Mixia osmundae IAM 14324]